MRPSVIGHFLILLLLGLPLASIGQAQDQPPVQVDLSVLNSMDPAAGRSPERPRLLTPYSSPVPAGINQPYRISSPPPEDVPAYKRAQAPARPAQPASPSASELVFYPVKVQERSEQYDPSLGMPATEPLHKRPAKAAFNPPLPELKPVMVATRKPEPTPPLPPKQPSIKEVSAAAEQKPAPIQLGKGSMEMPAVPAKRVLAEPLKPPPQYAAVSDDELAKQLVTPDRLALAKSIEAVTAKAEALAARAAAAPAIRKEPAPVSPQASRAKSAGPIDITAVEPAAGFQTASLPDITEIPRQPPEEGSHELEYVSLQFTPGATDVNSETLRSLDGKIIPLLKQNPAWRLQIQAFASKTGSDVENARRTSLSRALAIRSHLLDKGIESKRMDVRALGMQSDRAPLDRVDFVFFDPSVSD